MWYIPLDKVIAKNPMKDEDVTKLNRTDFPEMDWKEHTIYRMRYSWVGGFNQMYLGDETDLNFTRHRYYTTAHRGQYAGS